MKKIDWELVLYVLVAFVALVVSLGIPYFIAASDLPDWFKFWLLK